ncbi:hypothetical protein [Vallitalea guaymasensis]|uniref:hypothetical protein n=1 Tax=Vallitalea guaymasensis TaxID=1185412 RepID=UPI000DE280ED|nr:hypothetical protein [Vallitalea guaymasensis]
MGYYEEIIPMDGFFIENIAICTLMMLYTENENYMNEIMQKHLLKFNDFPGRFYYESIKYLSNGEILQYEEPYGASFIQHLFVFHKSIKVVYDYLVTCNNVDFINSTKEQIKIFIEDISFHSNVIDYYELGCKKIGTYGFYFLIDDCSNFYFALTSLINFINFFIDFEEKYILKEDEY